MKATILNNEDIVEELEDIKYRLSEIEKSLIYIERFSDYVVNYLNENSEFIQHVRSKKFKALRDENIEDI